MRLKIITLFFVATLGACATLPNDKSITPFAETMPVGVQGDAADDPAIWTSKDGNLVRIIGTQKKGGIYLYDLKGQITQEILGGRPNNVDLNNDFSWPDKKVAPIIVTSDRIDNSAVIYRFDEEKLQIEPIPKIRINSGFNEIYGICIGKINGNTYVGATSKIGDFKLFKIDVGENISATQVSSISLGSIAEGCVFDARNGEIYISQELVGIWKLSLDNQNKLVQSKIDDLKNPNLKPDIEGLAIWYRDEKAYLIASIQGISEFALYDISNSHKYIGSFKIKANQNFDEVSGTDGLDVNSNAKSNSYSNGIIVTQDDVNTNPKATQNFKITDFIAVLKKFDLLEKK